MIVIPFEAEFVENPIHKHQKILDPNFKERLFEEREAILNWLIEGCLLYQKKGLIIPSIVQEKSNAYREENDYISQFLKEMCHEGFGLSTQKSKMQKAIKEYCQTNGFKPPTRDEIFDRLKQKYPEKRSSLSRHWIGVGIKEEQTLTVKNL